ncbi:30S ribosomal protein S2 [Candidatus Rhabdochlamydia sp. T3358]|nr:30S ribosomal protein S2 [Candidatus Rhabdochlamydia sp. T3358]
MPSSHKGQSLEQQEQYKEVTIKTLLESGAHFGHQRHRWNPKMKRFIFEERNGIYIIDLSKTLQQIRNAIQVVMNTVSKRKSILFVGTKKQAKGLVRECAKQCGEFYVCERWLGGTLTNLTTIRQSIKKLERIEKKIALNADDLTKKELSLLTKDQIKLDRNFSGVRSMRKPPGLLIVVDPSREHIAVAEAKKLGVPVMALVDTNCNPDPIDYIIACNDDALKSIKLILEALTQAILQRKQELKLTTAKEDLEEESSSKEEQEGAK